jgi:hypothetical protein
MCTLHLIREKLTNYIYALCIADHDRHRLRKPYDYVPCAWSMGYRTSEAHGIMAISSIRDQFLHMQCQLSDQTLKSSRIPDSTCQGIATWSPQTVDCSRVIRDLPRTSKQRGNE